MITTMLLDDEKPALKMLEIQLGYYDNVKILGSYTAYATFLEEAKKNKPDIVFIDIEMPEKTGMEIAIAIKKAQLNSKIVFVTAYKEYAYDAFEVAAEDYILKPVRKERLKRIIDKVVGERSLEQEGDKKLYVKLMKQFEVRQPNGELIKWRTKKVEELLTFLIHNGEAGVSGDMIIEALWQDYDVVKAKKLLYTTIYYLRKDLNKYQIDISTGGQKYMINKSSIQEDVTQLEEMIDFCKSDKAAIEIMDKLFKLYTGDYLEQHNFWWAEKKRTQLKLQWMQAVMDLSENLIKQDKWRDAEFALKRLIEIEPYDEGAYKKLIEIYGMTGDKVNIRKLQEAYVKAIKELGVEPSATL